MSNNTAHRKQIRLPCWDYSSEGWYYITICTYRHAHHFGEVHGHDVVLNALGKAANAYWKNIREVYGIGLDEYVIMPNHVHGILCYDFAELKPVGEVVGSFKRLVSRWAKSNGFEGFMWQDRYYDRIIRDDKELERIRYYIHHNPLMWELEKGNPENLGEL